MYNIHQTHVDEMPDDTKIRFLFNKIDHEGLSKTVEAMKTKIDTEVVGTVTYKTVANHLSTAVSALPDYLARNCNRQWDKTGVVVVVKVVHVLIMVSLVQMVQSILDITVTGQM